MCNPFVRFGVAIIAWLALSCFFAGANATSFNIIYYFKGGRDGASPSAPLINVGGTLYGITANGGGRGCGTAQAGCGTVFSITPAGVETVLYRFQGGYDGQSPRSLVRAGNTLIGISEGNVGWVIFSITPPGPFSVVATVQSEPLGVTRGWLAQLGTAYYGVTGGNQITSCSGGLCGYVFSITP
jgi:uncharacterized repeat protein (TIGR03803 family)